MAGTTENDYFTWLYSQVGVVALKNPRRTHWHLLRKLHSTEFVWLIANDDNRVEDGRELRHEYFDLFPQADGDTLWLDLGCSMLEMLVGLSRRASFETSDTPADWFWRLLENVGLTRLSDHVWNRALSLSVAEACNRITYRTYDRSGKGGLFPLVKARRDQRKVELWYQLSSYLMETDAT